MVRSVRAAGSEKMMLSKVRVAGAVKGWVNHLLGFVQLGLGLKIFPFANRLGPF